MEVDGDSTSGSGKWNKENGTWRGKVGVSKRAHDRKKKKIIWDENCEDST